LRVGVARLAVLRPCGFRGFGFETLRACGFGFGFGFGGAIGAGNASGMMSASQNARPVRS